MKQNYLYKDKVNWPQLEQETTEKLAPYNNFKSSLAEVTTLFDKAEATHCSVYFADKVYSFTYDGPTKKDFSPEWQEVWATKPKFEVKVLDNQYVYILMPNMSSADNSSENTHNIAQPMYDQINTIKQSADLKGWIIDLRFNPGGDCAPMLLALYDFLGDTNVFGVLDINKKKVSTTKLKKGKYYDDKYLTSYINPSGQKLTDTKVALIIGNITASSGEVVALAFKGRENTIFIGQSTMGKTTTNTKKDLPFGAYMAITIGYDTDRNGKFYDKIAPDVTIANEDNYKDLMSDGNVKAAVKIFNGK